MPPSVVNMVEGGGFEPPKLARQIYSLIPLATREPLQKGAHSLDVNRRCQPISELIFPVSGPASGLRTRRGCHWGTLVLVVQ